MQRRGQGVEKEKREAYIRASEGLELRLLDEVEKFKTELVSARELQRIIKLNQRDFLDRMSSNEDMAATLATLEVQIGWRYLTGYQRKTKRPYLLSPGENRTGRRRRIVKFAPSVAVVPAKPPGMDC